MIMPYWSTSAEKNGITVFTRVQKTIKNNYLNIIITPTDKVSNVKTQDCINQQVRRKFLSMGDTII